MSLLYVVLIDESGNLKERKDEIIVHSILCMNYKVLAEVSETVNQMLHDTRSRFNIRNLCEFHAKEIVQRESYWNKVPPEERVRIFERLIDTVKVFNIYVFCAISCKRANEKPSKVVAKTLSKLLKYIELLPEFIEKIDNINVKYQAYTVIFDESPYIRHRIENIEKEITERLHRKGVSRAGISIKVGSSKDYIGLQLSDIIAYTLREVLIGRYKVHDFDFARYLKQLLTTGRFWIF